LTNSALGAPGVMGVQEPRISWIPPYASTTGDEALEVCEMAGLHLDPWEQFALVNALGESADWKCAECTHRAQHRIACPRHPDTPLIHPWAALEVGVNVARQNGKGAILEARELVGLFLLEERLIMHSAHLFSTSLEAFRRLLDLIESAPDLDREVQRVARSHGEEGIELKNGARIFFKTRTKASGRGLSGDCVILDEAMILMETSLGALMPTLSARPNPQLWYTGSAVDQEVHEHGLVFARIRHRGMHDSDPRLMYVEWSADGSHKDLSEVLDDPDAWAQANPALGIRIDAAFVGSERRAMADRTFAVERLGIGDWPDIEALAGQIISLEAWRKLADRNSTLVGPVCFAFDVNPDRTVAAISVAGRRSDGLGHLEVVKRDTGTDWLIDDLITLTGKFDAVGIVCDGKSPAASLVDKLNKRLRTERRNIEVTVTSTQEHVQACGMLYDAVDQATIRHLDTLELQSALKGAGRRPLGDAGAWAWSRRSSAVDISPLVSVTLAWWGTETIEPPKRVPMVAFR
jgi:hypothetical protein